MRRAKVLWHDTLAGILSETEEGYVFQYDDVYLKDNSSQTISLTLPLRKEQFTSSTMFSFFDGLIPEGWLLDIVKETWKINPRDRMGLLMACCKDCIGAVSIVPEEETD
ncbi:MAG: HipA N-terminal domain-containing protein [Candidatus Neomarinimicrobiota bacterium]